MKGAFGMSGQVGGLGEAEGARSAENAESRKSGTLFSDDSLPVFVDGIGPPLQQIAEDYSELTHTFGGAADDVLALIAEIVRLRGYLTQIKEQQPRTLEKFQSHGVVFDGPLGNDPKNWQHVAFSVYTDLCEVDLWAQDALENG